MSSLFQRLAALYEVEVVTQKKPILSYEIFDKNSLDDIVKKDLRCGEPSVSTIFTLSFAQAHHMNSLWEIYLPNFRIELFLCSVVSVEAYTREARDLVVVK